MPLNDTNSWRTSGCETEETLWCHSKLVPPGGNKLWHFLSCSQPLGNPTTTTAVIMAFTRAPIMWYSKPGSSCEATASHRCPLTRRVTPSCPDCKHINKNLSTSLRRRDSLNRWDDCFPSLYHKVPVMSFFLLLWITLTLAFRFSGKFPGAINEWMQSEIWEGSIGAGSRQRDFD